MSNTDALIFVPREEHGLITDSLDRLLAEQIWLTGGWQLLWQQLAQAGLLGAALSEDDGGFGDTRALALLAERLGRAGVISPFVSSGIAATSLLCRVQPIASMGRLRNALVSGAVIAATNMSRLEQGGRSGVTVRGGSVSGLAQLVPFGAEAGVFFLVAESGQDECVVLLLQKSDVVIEQPVIGIDGAPYATLRLDDVAMDPSAVLASGRDADKLVAWTRDALVAMHCAEALGAMSVLVDMTRDYLMVRRQFGAQLSSFQALRHRLVDMDMAVTEARSVVEWAAGLLEEDDASARRQAVVATQFAVTKAALKVSQDAVQLHGGIGMANETQVGGYFKRLMTLPLLFGDEDDCAQNYQSYM